MQGIRAFKKLALGRRPDATKASGRLVRYSILVAFLLIAGAVLTNTISVLYFRYHEIQDERAMFLREITNRAVLQIQHFLQQVETQMRTATMSSVIARDGLSSPASYKFELQKLLATTPAITEALAADRRGRIRTHVSRTRAVFPDPSQDISLSDGFLHARQGVPYWGPVRFLRNSEPYMSMAVPIERFAGEVIGVLQADVDLKHIWEVVLGIKVGMSGYAYIVNRSGDLVTHPDLSMVLQRRNIADLEQVKEAFEATPGLIKRNVLTARNLSGEKVFVSYTTIPSLDWAVFVEQPIEEAYAPLYASLSHTFILLLVGLGMALFASALLGHQVVRPLQKLREGVERISSGDLDARVELTTGNELEMLANEFNSMTEALREARSDLEHKVATRTQELQATVAKLNEANQQKSQFLANMSHELRTPLNAILGFSRLVLRKTHRQIPAIQETNLEKVVVSAENLLQLINDLLDISKIEAGRMELLLEPLDVEDLITTVVSTVEPMRKANCPILQDVAGMPVIVTDRQKLQQILSNLLSNAIKFTHHGEIRISARQSDASLIVSVSDTGIGIPQSQLKEIFEEFFQVDGSGKTQLKGSGLGLAITKRLVELLRGTITVESRVGEGSTFTLVLPLMLQSQTEDDRNPNATRPPQQTPLMTKVI